MEGSSEMAITNTLEPFISTMYQSLDLLSKNLLDAMPAFYQVPCGPPTRQQAIDAWVGKVNEQADPVWVQTMTFSHLTVRPEHIIKVRLES